MGRGREVEGEERLMDQIRACAHTLRHRKQGQQRILTILREHGGMTQQKLREVLDVRSASVSEILAKVEADGFVLRSHQEADKRSMDVTLTEAGHAEAARIEARRGDYGRELFSCLAAEEKALLSSLLEKLLVHWRTQGFEPSTEASPLGEGEHDRHHHHGHRGSARHHD
jgi:DNA-binding MarR family transcriptional regulator